MAKLLIEIFEEAEKADNPVTVLEKNRTVYMDQFIDIMKVGVDWDLPEGEPPFKKDKQLPIESAPTSIYNIIRRFYIFDRKTQVQRVKREMLFIQMLEGLHWKEAQLILDLKNGEIPHKYPRIWKAVGGKPVAPKVVAPEPVVEVPAPAKAPAAKAKRTYYNDGTSMKLFVEGEQPDGWVKGRLKK
jgi:hypothetical protein